MQPVPLPPALQAVPRPVLEDYVGARVKQFSRALAGVLLPSITEQSFEFAFSRATQLLGQTVQEPVGLSDSYALRFTHRCKFLGCMRKDCGLCKNNPNKKCREEDNFDECYADGQVLKSKCESDVSLELINLRTGLPEALPSVEIAVTVVDGDSYSESAPANYGHVRELLKNDDESILLGAYQAGSKTDPDGRLYLRMTEGLVKLPDVCVTDKNDTFHFNNETFSTFRLMAKAVRREYGRLVVVENVRPTVSGKFIVKTQRALNDYRKSEYPHYKDELTKLKHIGSITAQRLREIQSHLDCPYSSIETVEQLKQLMLFADQNRQVENKMLELLNMKGKHKHKWDYLREVLVERVVYDDMLHRLWYTDESMTQGVLFACKQGQINMERPIGLVQRGQNGRLMVNSNPSGPDSELLKQWRQLAEADWCRPNHRNWVAVQEQLEMVNGSTSLLVGGGPSMSMAAGTPSMSMADGMDEGLLKRGSVGMAPSMMNAVNDERRSRRSSAVSYPQVPNSPKMEPGIMGMMQGQPQQQGASSSYGDLQHQGMLGPMGSGAGGQPPPQQQQQQFQFSGQRSMAAQALITSGGLTAGDLMPDVYRTASAPNMAASSPLYSHNSIDSPNNQSNLMGAGSGPNSNMGMPVPGPDGVLGPPPSRPARYRRLSADASAVRQMAMMQAAGMPQPEMSADLGKRSRNSAPGHPALEELQQQLQGQMQGQQSLQGPGGMQGQDMGQISMTNRHALYHFESRGRHTPRSRLSTEVSDTVAASAMGAVLDTSDLETFIQQNFTFATGEPTFSGMPADQQQPNLMGPMGGGVNMGPSSTSLSGPLMHMSLQPQQQPDQITGQMQNTLSIGDPAAARMGGLGPSGSGLMNMEPGMAQHHHMHQQHGMGMGMGQMGMGMGQIGGNSAAGIGMSGTSLAGGLGGSMGGGNGGGGVQQGRSLQHIDSGNMSMNPGARELKRCESDSFKRFLAVGLPFSPMEATPEDLFEGLRRDSGPMGE
ncbi:hypothetical protein HYH02_001670 [Chlamydomonas schloesseri]|uniref:Uncharacterized protein n=1 Tax=Chlamydomonas schloesseri TaxID=2026947 RepID=A0A835WSL7_9CHLO|nr:hypothetical protein HYH02_001670 [Chlamydomonas schloesseri]|eukprot:KAG2453449.1 hypothetical protein HYH02_001670 [Chlamydomonas schloesseri]